jgi:aerobic carbon-monoxide dehydrogenase medium subunit
MACSFSARGLGLWTRASEQRTQVKPAPFELHAPETIEEVLDLLAQYGDEAKVLAGGQSLVPMLALRLTRFEHLVDINRVEALAPVTRVNGSLRIGATTRHRVAVRDPDVAAAAPLLARATARVGHFQIRNRGTIGGAIAHADPAAEQPAVALALDAVIEAAGASGRREIPAAEFFLGTWSTALAADELLTGVRFPVWEGKTGFAVEEVARRAGDFALAGVVCALSVSSEGRPERVALGLFGVGPVPLRAKQAERALLAGSGLDEVAREAMAEIDPIDDLHASGEYRRKVAGVLVRRGIERAIAEAIGA